MNNREIPAFYVNHGLLDPLQLDEIEIQMGENDDQVLYEHRIAKKIRDDTNHRKTPEGLVNGRPHHISPRVAYLAGATNEAGCIAARR